MIKAKQKNAENDEEVCFWKNYQSSRYRDHTSTYNKSNSIPQLLPHLREVDRLFMGEVNDKFRLKGDKIFEVGT